MHLVFQYVPRPYWELCDLCFTYLAQALIPLQDWVRQRMRKYQEKLIHKTICDAYKNVYENNSGKIMILIGYILTSEYKITKK